MNDIPEMYLAEAVRRLDSNLDSKWRGTTAAYTLASTLQELGWTPPIDEARMAKARKVTAAVFRGVSFTNGADRIEQYSEFDEELAAIQAAYDALGED